MYVTKIEILNIKSFSNEHELVVSKNINIFTGRNNTGKSTVLKVIYQLQGFSFQGGDKSVFADYSESAIYLGTDQEHYQFINFPNNPYTKETVSNVRVHFSYEKNHPIGYYSPALRMWDIAGGKPLYVSFSYYSKSLDSNSLIYPFFSNRKVANYSKKVTPSERNNIDGTFQNLYAKIDYLASPGKPIFSLYAKYCKEILGFFVGTTSDEEGKYACFFVNDNISIPITAMGDGIPHILGLIADLCLANDKIFLIEEPENDLHPKALKALLSLIEEKSTNNQFFISTHSNIVLKYLGANLNSKVFQILAENTLEEDVKVPKSFIREISTDPIDRQQVLEDLGYDMFDYSLWKGWLFLEESSAELIIREFLIPKFASSLSHKLCTYAADGRDNVYGKFDDFVKLFTFINRDASYKNRAWVAIDDGIDEEAVINKLKSTYVKKGWTEDHFIQFAKHNFEDYYPLRFKDKIDSIYNISNSTNLMGNERREAKRHAKKELLEEVKAWYTNYPEEAESEFSVSASEIIDFLRGIEIELL